MSALPTNSMSCKTILILHGSADAILEIRVNKDKAHRVLTNENVRIEDCILLPQKALNARQGELETSFKAVLKKPFIQWGRDGAQFERGGYVGQFNIKSATRGRYPPAHAAAVNGAWLHHFGWHHVNVTSSARG